MTILNRKQLPAFGVLNNIKFDMEKVIEHCRDNGLFDFEQYNDMQTNKGTSIGSTLVTANPYTVNNFFIADDETPLNGERYRQLYFTEIDLTVITGEMKDTGGSTLSRMKRLNKNSPIYTPEADELNYTVRNDHVKGIFEEILDYFKSPHTRVRLAYLSPGFSIKPHVDHDPSYITRYHLPILTNDESTVHVIEKINGVEVEHVTKFPADGRLYFLNTGRKHWVANNGKSPRLHLIVDVHGQLEFEFLEKFE